MKKNLEKKDSSSEMGIGIDYCIVVNRSNAQRD